MQIQTIDFKIFTHVLFIWNLKLKTSSFLKTYLILEVKAVVCAIDEDLVEVIELGEDALGRLTQQVAFNAAILDLFQLHEVLGGCEQVLIDSGKNVDDSVYEI